MFAIVKESGTKKRKGKAADEQKDVSKGEGGLVAVMRWFVIV